MKTQTESIFFSILLPAQGLLLSEELLSEILKL